MARKIPIKKLPKLDNPQLNGYTIYDDGLRTYIITLKSLLEAGLGDAINEALVPLALEIGSKASEEGLEDAEERITNLEGLQETQHVWQAPDWSSLFARNGYFVIADDALGENRPDGLPVPESNEVIYYNVVSAGKNGEAGHNHPTLILQRHGTMEVYFVTLGDDSLITATRLVDSAELSTAISTINDAFSAIDDAIAGMATDIGNMTAEIGSIDTILDILNGDLEADIQEVLGNIEGV